MIHMWTKGAIISTVHYLLGATE